MKCISEAEKKPHGEGARTRQGGRRELSGSAVTYTLAEHWASAGPSEGECA